jgi:AraC-like DNA-binding protein
MNTHEKLIDTLVRSKIFQKYERAYNEAFGMPVTLRFVESWQLPFRRKRKENPFCGSMAEKSSTCAACLQLQATLAEAAMNKSATKTCAFGLCETAVPVKLGSETIGFLQTGQVMRANPSEKSFQHTVQEAARRGIAINNKKNRAAYFATKVISSEKLAAASSLLEIFADQLSTQSNQLAIQSRTTETPMIARARQFIHQHHREVLSLSRVASAIHVNYYTLCKLFPKATGVKFTEFISRIRIEDAKNLLLNFSLNISEIGFESGFQSLTHFNRMFKKIIGESPLQFRSKLPRIKLSAL